MMQFIWVLKHKKVNYDHPSKCSPGNGCLGSSTELSHDLWAPTIYSVKTRRFSLLLQVNSGVSNTDLLRGKIIKIAVKCTLMNGRESRRWLMFKFVGNISCECLPIFCPISFFPAGLEVQMLNFQQKNTINVVKNKRIICMFNNVVLATKNSPPFMYISWSCPKLRHCNDKNSNRHGLNQKKKNDNNNKIK